jgi:hypothetical protein
VGESPQNVPKTGAFSIFIGVTLGPFAAGFTLANIQAALNTFFPGAVAMGAVPSGPGDNANIGNITLQFPDGRDPGIAATITGNTMIDSTDAGVQITVSPNPAGTYPNYFFLTTRWPEFAIKGAVTDALLQAAEQTIIALKTDAWKYVQPKNWGGFKGAFVQATFLMIAHLRKLGKDPVGFITSQDAKNLSESYSDDKWLAGTVYGQEFMRLRNARILTNRYIPAGRLPRTLGPLQGGFEGPHDGDFIPIN